MASCAWLGLGFEADVLLGKLACASDSGSPGMLLHVSLHRQALHLEALCFAAGINVPDSVKAPAGGALPCDPLKACARGRRRRRPGTPSSWTRPRRTAACRWRWAWTCAAPSAPTAFSTAWACTRRACPAQDPTVPCTPRTLILGLHQEYRLGLHQARGPRLPRPRERARRRARAAAGRCLAGSRAPHLASTRSLPARSRPGA